MRDMACCSHCIAGATTYRGVDLPCCRHCGLVVHGHSTLLLSAGAYSQLSKEMCLLLRLQIRPFQPTCASYVTLSASFSCDQTPNNTLQQYILMSQTALHADTMRHAAAQICTVMPEKRGCHARSCILVARQKHKLVLHLAHIAHSTSA